MACQRGLARYVLPDDLYRTKYRRFGVVAA